jgi:hypothetical protein
MNRLPNFEKAVILIEKLSEYCLSEIHPKGKDKAIVFKSALGMTSLHAEILREKILNALAESECIENEPDQFGRRFSVLMKITNFDREAIVTTGWIIKPDEDFPRLTTCYVENDHEN